MMFTIANLVVHVACIGMGVVVGLFYKYWKTCES